MFGRRILMTTLDPIPRPFRACPGVIVLNSRELNALKVNDGDVFKELADIVQSEDAAEARGFYRYPLWKKPKTKAPPSLRLLGAAAIYKGRN